MGEVYLHAQASTMLVGEGKGGSAVLGQLVAALQTQQGLQPCTMVFTIL